MPKDLTALFYPESVAVVGASRSSEKVGAIILKNIIDSGFKGEIYPVNPNADRIGDLKCFKDIESIPSPPDLAVIAIPAGAVVGVVDQVGSKGVKNAVVISAGFKEVGEEGEKLEKDLILKAEKYNMNLLGPNCLGFVNNLCPINTTFSQPINEAGNLRFISQSGAIASALFDWSNSVKLGISEFITLGNKAVLSENEVLQYFLSQSENTLNSIGNEGLSDVSPIGLYLESIEDGTKFLNIVGEISKKDPVLIIKPGKTKAAERAMQSHTGSIAGEDDVLEALLAQAGVIRCQTLEDFFDFSRAFAWEDIPQGPNVAVISNAGGPAVISADAVVEEGLNLAEFNSEVKEALARALPRSASIINPVDVLGDALAERFAEAAEIIIQKDNVHSLVVILTPQLMTQMEKTADSIGSLSKKYGKPIFASFIGGNLVSEGEKKLNEYKIPSFRYPERAIAAIGAMWKYSQYGEREDSAVPGGEVQIPSSSNIVRQTIQRAVNENQKTLDNVSADKIISSVGIKTPPTCIVSDLEQAREFVRENGWPVVLKLSSPGLLHKKEVGGVILDIIDDEKLEDAWHKLERKVEQLDEKIQEHVGFQIQKDILDGVELIVGVKHDPTFGPVLLFGAGGTYAELIDDKNLHLLPVNISEAKKLVERSKVYSILEESSGGVAYPLEGLYELIVRLGKLALSVPEASDVEINPVIVTINNVWAVDSKVVLHEGEEKPKETPKLQVAKTLSHKVLATQFHFYEFETEEPFEFKPGQYISVKVAPDAIRAYSIAAHGGPKKFGLLVDTRPGGPGSKFFENLKTGDKITFLGPFGVFTFKPDDGSEHILFLATGSGASALRCMIDTALMEYNVKKPMTLYFGLTHPEEVFWEDHFKDLAQKYPNFSYEYAVCEPDETWEGCRGFITKPLKENFPDASKCSAYLCGHRAMIADATEILLENGCSKERIYSERFV